MSRRLVFLTPSYTGKADMRQRWGLVTGSLLAVGAGWKLLGDGFCRGLLDESRNRLMQTALASRADVAVWIDDDVHWQNQRVLPALLAWIEQAPAAVIAACNVPTQHGEPNAWKLEGEPAEWTHRGPVARVGFGLCAMDLRWYRDNWPSPSPVWFQTLPRFDETGIVDSYGEDFRHCDTVRELGGRIDLIGDFDVRNSDADRRHPAAWIR